MTNAPVTTANQPAAAPQPLLRELDVARLLGVSPSKLRLDRSRGQGIPALKIGRLIRYRPADVAAYLGTCRIGAQGARHDPA